MKATRKYEAMTGKRYLLLVHVNNKLLTFYDRLVYSALVRTPKGLSNRQLSSFTGVARNTVARRVERLRQFGLIKYRKGKWFALPLGKRWVYALADGSSLVGFVPPSEIQESYPDAVLKREFDTTSMFSLYPQQAGQKWQQILKSVRVYFKSPSCPLQQTDNALFWLLWSLSFRAGKGVIVNQDTGSRTFTQALKGLASMLCVNEKTIKAGFGRLAEAGLAKFDVVSFKTTRIMLLTRLESKAHWWLDIKSIDKPAVKPASVQITESTTPEPVKRTQTPEAETKPDHEMADFLSLFLQLTGHGLTNRQQAKLWKKTPHTMKPAEFAALIETSVETARKSEPDLPADLIYGVMEKALEKLNRQPELAACA